MFENRRNTSNLTAAANILELVYFSIVYSVRKTHNNAVMALLLAMLQVFVFVMAFYIMFSVLGLRGAAMRGDFMLYIMSGVFLFMTHIKAVGAVSGADNAVGGMMLHAPMNTAISIMSSALSALYIQTISMIVVLFGYHVLITPVEIEYPVAAFGMYLLAWFDGVAIGLCFMSLSPWFPQFTSILSTVYQRANMIFSGKMFVANSLPNFMLVMFLWNPLFHCIDQSRGFVFLNYTPTKTSLMYPLYFGLVALMIGLMGEFYTRKHVSISWRARG